jgi:hypothetical protein
MEPPFIVTEVPPAAAKIPLPPSPLVPIEPLLMVTVAPVVLVLRLASTPCRSGRWS